MASVIALHVGNLLLQLSYLLFLQHALVLDGHNLDEVLHVTPPVVEHPARQPGSGIQVMLANQLVQLLAVRAFFHEVDFHHVHVAEVVEVVAFVPHVGHAAAHARREVAPGLSQHHDAASGHVLAAVVARPLDNGNGPGVAHGEAFAHLPVDVQLAGSGPVKPRVAGYGVVLRR